jgi:hypothetical protein
MEKVFSIFIICIFVIGLVFISGCTSSPQTTSQTTPQGNTISTPTYSNTYTQSVYDPMNIEIFSVVTEGDVLRFYFGFDDRSGHDAEVKCKITDAVGNIVLENQFLIKSDQFVDYEFKLTGKPMGKVYEWKIPVNSIKKGFSQIGTGYLTVILPSGKNLTSSNTYISIPAYSEQEIVAIYDQEYNRVAKVSGQSIKGGAFQVTLNKYGYYSHLKYNTWGDKVTDFRADIVVQNIGNEKEYYRVYDAVLLVGDKQYSYSYQSKFDSGEIYPGVKREGYLLFENVPPLSGKGKIITGTSGYGSEENKYEFSITL